MPADTLPFEIVSPENGLPYCISTVDGLRIGWDTCAACLQHIINCTHDVPVEPSYIRGATAPTTDVRGEVDYSYTGITRKPARKAGLNVMDLVDQDLVDKIKTASKERSDGSA